MEEYSKGQGLWTWPLDGSVFSKSFRAGHFTLALLNPQPATLEHGQLFPTCSLSLSQVRRHLLCRDFWVSVFHSLSFHSPHRAHQGIC